MWNSQVYTVYFAPDGTKYLEINVAPEPPIGRYVCLLTTETGVNLRVGPGGNLDRFGTAVRGETLRAVGQAMSNFDGMIWWQLDRGGWVRSDFVAETTACAELPLMNPTQLPLRPSMSAEAVPGDTVPTQAGDTCILVVLNGAYLRTGPGTEFDAVSSTTIDQQLTADGQYANQQDYFIWWHLTSGEWVREDLDRKMRTAISFLTLTSHRSTK